MLTGSRGILTAATILTRSPGIDTSARRCLPGHPVSLPRLRYPYRINRYRYFSPPMLTGSSGILIAAPVSLPDQPVSILQSADAYRVTRYPYRGSGILTGSLGIDTSVRRCLPSHAVSLTAAPGILTGSPRRFFQAGLHRARHGHGPSKQKTELAGRRDAGAPRECGRYTASCFLPLLPVGGRAMGEEGRG
jgi:hypothetical protein